MNFPVLIKPRFLAIKNRLRCDYDIRKQFGRDLVVGVFSIAMIIAIYSGTVSAIQSIKDNSAIAYIPPAVPLSMLLMMLLVMLALSTSVSVIGSFFQGRDLDLVLSSPVTIFELFCGKFLDVLSSASWMAFIFILPAVAAFGVSYNAPLWYYPAALAIIAPYFVIPAALATAIITFLSRLIPLNRAREIILVIILAVSISLFFSLESLGVRYSDHQNLDQVLKLISSFSLPQSIWLPSFWTAQCISSLLTGEDGNFWAFMIMLYSSALACMTLAFLAIRTWHNEAYSRTQSSRSKIRIGSRRSQQILIWFLPWVSPPFRAMIAKEFKSFARDISQAIQLLMLLGLCLIYLYHFKVLNAVQGLPAATRMWWHGFLIFSNVGMGAFVVTAVCSRFVFPSVSMEGQSFWILQSSPIKTIDILRVKFWTWFVPVAFMSTVIFVSGAFAIGVAPQILMVNVLTSWVICYGIVGLAVGLGALFANFEWENSAQLSASFGSLVFMLSSAVLIVISLIPVGILIFLRTLKNFGYSISDTQWYLCVGTTTFLLIYLNYFIARWALKTGQNALELSRS